MELASCVGDSTVERVRPPLRKAFAASCTHAAPCGGPLLLWSQWIEFVRGLPPSLRCRGLMTKDSALALSLTCTERYGQLTESVATPVPVASGSGSGRRATTALTFPEVHTMICERALVDPINAFFAGRGSIAPLDAKHLDEQSWADAATHLVVDVVGGFDAEDDLLEPICSENLCAIIANIIKSATSVQVDTYLLLEHIAPLCRLVEASRFVAHIICRCDIIVEIIGNTIARVVRAYAHRSAHCMYLEPDRDIAQRLVQELVDTRQSLTKLKCAAAAGFIGHFDFDVERRTMITGRTVMQTARDAHKTEHSVTLEWAINSNLAFKNAPDSLVEAERVIRIMRGSPDVAYNDLIERLCSAQTYGRHAIVMDIALDKMMADRILQVACFFKHKPHLCLPPDV
jgi:hypothetical protein